MKGRTVDDGLIMDRDLKLLRESRGKSGLPCADLQASTKPYANIRNHVWGGMCGGESEDRLRGSNRLKVREEA